MTHFMLDIETLGLKPGCQLLTIACLRFDPYDLEDSVSFYRRVQIDLTYYIDPSTEKWWSEQTPSVRYEALEAQPRYSLDAVMREFVDFVRENSTKNTQVFVWSHGKEFDIPIVERYLNDLRIPIPWKFWNTRDTRTLYDVCNVNLRELNFESKYEKHHALYDAELQALGVRCAYKKLNELQYSQKQ